MQPEQFDAAAGRDNGDFAPEETARAPKKNPFRPPGGRLKFPLEIARTIPGHATHDGAS